MDEKVFDRLEENIAHDGILTQLPFVQKLPNGRYEIISGNHRIKAAKKAGLLSVWCITCEVTLPEDEKIRIQISHNTIRGEHNALILKEILGDIEDIDAIRRSGADIDISTLKIDKIEFKSIDANALDIRQVVLYFTNPDIRALDRLISNIDTHLTGSSRVYLAEHKKFKEFIEAIVKVKSEANIVSSGMALSLIIEYANNNVDNIISYYEETYGEEKVTEVK